MRRAVFLRAKETSRVRRNASCIKIDKRNAKRCTDSNAGYFTYTRCYMCSRFIPFFARISRNYSKDLVPSLRPNNRDDDCPRSLLACARFTIANKCRRRRKMVRLSHSSRILTATLEGRDAADAISLENHRPVKKIKKREEDRRITRRLLKFGNCPARVSALGRRGRRNN